MFYFFPFPAWRNTIDPGLAADQYRMDLLHNKEDEPTLKVKLDIGDDEDDREAQIISFYKAPNVDWARPFQAKLQGIQRLCDSYINKHIILYC